MTTASFPSGHVVRCTVALGLLLALVVWRSPRGRLLGTAGVVVCLLLMGIARVASGEHWPTDVLGGYLLGALWCDLVLLALRWRRRVGWPGRTLIQPG